LVSYPRNRKADNKNNQGGIGVNIFILAHILADFVFQKDSEVEEKSNGTIKGNLKHIFKVSILYSIAAVSFLLLAEIRTFNIILLVFTFIGVNIVLHFLFDLTKSRLQKKWVNKKLLLLIADQALHILVLFISFNLILGDFLSLTYQGDNYIVLLIFLSIATFVSSVVVREILDMFHLESKEEIPNQIKKNDVSDAAITSPKEAESNEPTTASEASKCDADDEMKIGKWIGIIERTIMFLSIYFNILGLLTIVVAFKTLTRYENIKKNPEYYIIGNLLSILLVLITYGIFKQWV